MIFVQNNIWHCQPPKEFLDSLILFTQPLNIPLSLKPGTVPRATLMSLKRTPVKQSVGNANTKAKIQVLFLIAPNITDIAIIQCRGKQRIAPPGRLRAEIFEDIPILHLLSGDIIEIIGERPPD